MARKTVQVDFTRRAASEVAEAKSWWSEHRPAAPGAIGDDLERALQLLAVQPSVGAKAASTRFPGVRRVLLERVGYHVYYRFEARRRVLTILAFWHSRSGEGPEV